MGRKPNAWVEFCRIPTEFIAEHRIEVEDACDKETSLWCYCGRLATGLHTQTCRQYIKHFRHKMEELYNASNRTTCT